MAWGQKRRGRRGGSGWGWGGDGDGGGSTIIHAVVSGITEVVAGGVLRAFKSSFDDDTTGWWLGVDPADGVAKINIGNDNYHVIWNGTSLDINGSIGGNIVDLLLSEVGALRAVKASYSDTTAGFWLGIDGGTPKLNIGNASYSLKWTGLALEVLGSIGGTVSNLVVATNGAIRSGKTVFGDATAGWWIGMDGGDPKIDIGAAQDHLQWDGSALDIVGAIGGTITALVLAAANSALRAGKTSFSDTTAGFWLGLDTTTPKFNIGDASNYFQWNGSVLQILGRIGGEITDLVLSSAGTFRANKTTFDDTTAGWWLGIDEDTLAKFNIGNGSNYLKWTGLVLQVAGALSGKITDLQMADNGVQVRAGKTSFADTTAGFWLGVSAGGYPQFHIGNATNWWKFDASASPPITYQFAIDGADIDAGTVTASKLDVSSLDAVSSNTGTLDVNQAIRVVKTSPTDVTKGAWLGVDSGTPKFYVGDSTRYLKFDGADVYFKSSYSKLGANGLELYPSGAGHALVLQDGGYDPMRMTGTANTGEDTNEGLIRVVGYSAITLPNASLELQAYPAGGGHTADVALVAIGGSFSYVQLSGDSINVLDAFMELNEITEPGAPATDYARLYLKDNGSGKTQLCVRFATGAVQVLATEP